MDKMVKSLFEYILNKTNFFVFLILFRVIWSEALSEYKVSVLPIHSSDEYFYSVVENII